MYNENQVNEVYEKMINTSDIFAEKGITEESVSKLEDLKSSFDQLTSDNFDENDLSNEADKEEHIECESKEVLTLYNPTTGDQVVVDGSEDYMAKIAENNWQSFLSGNSQNITSDIVKCILNGDEFKSDDDASKLASVMARRMAGENFNYYDEMPDSMKATVDDIIKNLRMSGNVPKNAPGLNRKYVAKMLLDDCISDYKKDSSSQMDLDSVLAGFDKDIENMENEISTELGGMMMSFDEERIAEINAAIKRCEESGNTKAIENLNAIKSTIGSAFDIKEFIEFCKTCKIKNPEIENPKRVYNHFNHKYENHKNVINDIKSCPIILSRHLTDYTMLELNALCVAFCKYCQNMSPDNMSDHTFMYYFIRNIIAIDRLNPKGNLYEGMDDRSKKFYDEFTTNLKLALNNVIERNKDRLNQHKNND